MTVNFDNAATTYPKPPEVRRAVADAVVRYGNAGRGGHVIAERTSELVYHARETVAEFFDAKVENTIFTLNCTHALNVAIQGILKSGDHVIFSDLEHNSVYRPIMALARAGKVTYSMLEVSADNSETLRRLAGLVRPNTKAVVCTTFTTYDEDLCRILEPNVCTTRRRFEMLRTCREQGIHTGVWLCPILPFLNDTEKNLRGLLDYCFDAGVEVIVNFGMGVTLRDGDRQYFYAQLDRHFPGMKERYIRSFGDRYDCPSPNAARLSRILREECESRGVICEPEAAMAYLMEFEDKQAGEQLNLFT